MSPARLRTYGFDAVALSNAYDLPELSRLREHVQAHHANPLDGNGHPTEDGHHSIHLYDKAGRKKLDAIAMAVTFRLKERAA